MGKRRNKEVGTPSATSQQLQPGKKKLKLKSAKKIVKISSKGNSELSEKVNTEDSKNVKNIPIKVDGSIQLNQQREAKATETEANAKETISGFVFMCNSKTKPDCFHYKVLGLPEHRKDVVIRIKPGMRLFLYDFDLKLLYGIFKASSHGGMKLEPAAFNGLYSAQVRFEVERVSTPLPYHIFKNAIKDNLTGIRNMFKTELSFDQVKELTKLFSSSPPQQPTSVNKVAPPASQPVQVVAAIQPPVPISWPKMHPLDRPPPLQRERVLHREIVQAPIGAVPLDPRFLHEEHITFGLNPNPFLLPPATSHGNAPDFYTHPYRAAGPYETKIIYQDDPPFPASHISLPYDMPRMSNFELAASSRDVRMSEMLPISAPSTLSGYSNRISQPVSSRYSFAGPSMAYSRGHAS